MPKITKKIKEIGKQIKLIIGLAGTILTMLFGTMDILKEVIDKFINLFY